jgi:hypothetical protein
MIDFARDDQHTGCPCPGKREQEPTVQPTETAR